MATTQQAHLRPQVTLGSLPEELLSMIIDRLYIQAVSALSQTSKLFYRLSDWTQSARREELLTIIFTRSLDRRHWHAVRFTHIIVKEYEYHDELEDKMYAILPPDRNGEGLIISRYRPAMKR